MKTDVPKKSEKATESFAAGEIRKQIDKSGTFQFKDQRAGTIARRKLKALVNEKGRGKQLSAIQRFADEQLMGLPGAQDFSGGTEPTVQRTPEEWADAESIQRMLGHAHGYFSTWKKVKEKIREYTQLQAASVVARKNKLNQILPLLDEWEADPKHGPDSEEQRVMDIRADIPLLRTLIEREFVEVEDRIARYFFQTGENPFPDIPATLSQGIEGLGGNAAKAARLFQNINQFRFRYVGGGVPGRVAFTAHQGDCGTLVSMYEEVANHFHIPYAQGSQPGRQLAAPRPIHGRPNTSNTDGNTDWYFQSHHWAIGAGTAYDLLFMVSPPPASTLTNGQAVHNGVTYFTFADGRCVIEPNSNDLLTYRIKGQGKVFVNAAAAQDFIDDNRAV